MTAVGSILELASWVLFVAALAHGQLRRSHRGLWASTLLLAVGVTVQATLGHIPSSATIAVHVPLGVALFAWSVTAPRRLTALPAAPAPAVAVGGR